ncbi:hypothetical protein [Planctobacterium marinum]|uniref:hypothetical protein n=1 Tax=Planctobacterium marinum TaxID=1631968 RepID=UPI001E5DD240|nr:hypothetical protein [Planctobacterium marinum]MCC2605922.1 hypothetical protein [Planctobacterium marinum]
MRMLNQIETSMVTGGVTGDCTGSTQKGTSSGPRPGETLLEYYLRTQAEQQEGTL